MEGLNLAWLAASAAAGLVAGLGLCAVWMAARKRSNRDFSAITPEGPPGEGEGHRPPSATSMAAQLLSLAKSATSARGAVLLRQTHGGWTVAAADAATRARRGREFALKEGLLGLAMESRKELAADPVQPGALPFLEDISGPCAVLFVPAGLRNETLGMLVLFRQSGAPFEAKEQATASKAAFYLAGLESLFAHAERLDGAQARQERVAAGLERMLRQADPVEIAGSALDALFDLLPARTGFAVIHATRAQYHALVTKGFAAPQGFDRLERETWAYWVLTKGGEPLYLDGAAGRETAMPLLCSGEEFPQDKRVALVMPLKGTAEAIGVIGAVGTSDCPFGEQDRAVAAFFASQTGALMELALLNRMNAEMALKDSLTGLFNRRHFDEQIRMELRRAQREGTFVSLVIADIDHFKQVNDLYGHPAGDSVLREVASRLRSAVRDVDAVCRYGGEEFAVILPACPIDEAVRVAERVRHRVGSAPHPVDSSTRLDVTVSLGVSAFPKPVDNGLQLVRAADEALYKAKNSGRNRVCAG